VTFLLGFVDGYQGVAMQFDFKFLPGCGCKGVAMLPYPIEKMY